MYTPMNLNGTFNVATEPFPTLSLETTTKGSGFQVISQSQALVPLKVVYAALDLNGQIHYNQLDIVYVTAQDKTADWAKRIIELEGKRFILVPNDRVVLVSPAVETQVDARKS